MTPIFPIFLIAMIQKALTGGKFDLGSNLIIFVFMFDVGLNKPSYQTN